MWEKKRRDELKRGTVNKGRSNEIEMYKTKNRQRGSDVTFKGLQRLIIDKRKRNKDVITDLVSSVSS